MGEVVLLCDEWPETGVNHGGQLLGGAGEQRVVVVEQFEIARRPSSPAFPEQLLNRCAGVGLRIVADRGRLQEPGSS